MHDWSEAYAGVKEGFTQARHADVAAPVPATTRLRSLGYHNYSELCYSLKLDVCFVMDGSASQEKDYNRSLSREEQFARVESCKSCNMARSIQSHLAQ